MQKFNINTKISQEDESDANLEMYRLKKTIQNLDSKKGFGTSLLTITIGSKDQLTFMRQKLVEEIGKAANIKTRITKQNAIDALVSAGERLKLYNKTPANGLVLFSGVTDTNEKLKLCF